MVAQFRSLSFFAVVLAVGVGWISVPPRANAEDGKTALPEYRTWIGDFDGMQKRRQIRIIVPYSKTIFFIDKGEQLGTAAEWGDEFDKWLNKGIKSELERIRIAFVPTPREQLLTALNDGRGDIVAANLTITPDRLQKVDFTIPALKDVHEILVSGRPRQKLEGLKTFPARNSIFGRPAAITNICWRSTTNSSHRSSNRSS